MMIRDQNTEKGIESRSKKSLASSLSHRGNDPEQTFTNIKRCYGLGSGANTAKTKFGYRDEERNSKKRKEWKPT